MMNATAKIIKKLMIDCGISGAAIARALRCDRTNIYHVIEGRSKSKKVRKAIAEALGVHISELWPDEKPKRAA